MVFLALTKIIGFRSLSSSLTSRLISLLLLGFVRGFAIYVTAGGLSLSQPSSLNQRVGNSVMTTVVWLGLFACLFEANDRYKRRYQALVSQLLISKLDPSAGPDTSFSIAAQDLLDFQDSLKSVYTQAVKSPNLQKAAEEASKGINAQLEETLKPIVHEIWSRSLMEAPRINPRALMKISIIEPRLNLGAIAPIYWFTSMINYGLALGLPLGFIISSTSTFLLILLESVRRRIVARIEAKGATVNFIFFLFIGPLIVSFPLQMTLGTGIIELLPFILILGMFVDAILISFSMISHAIGERSSMILRLEDELLTKSIDSERSKTFDASSDFQLSSYLHNSFQSELRAIAYELKGAAKEPSEGKIESALDKFAVFLEKSIYSDFVDYLESPKERLVRVVKSWESLVELLIDFDDEILEDPVRSSIFVQFVQEVISNAVRSGGATKIVIRGQYEEGIFRVDVKNDGVLNVKDSGLGTLWIERLSLKRRNIEQVGKETRLQVEF